MSALITTFWYTPTSTCRIPKRWWWNAHHPLPQLRSMLTRQQHLKQINSKHTLARRRCSPSSSLRNPGGGRRCCVCGWYSCTAQPLRLGVSLCCGGRHNPQLNSIPFTTRRTHTPTSSTLHRAMLNNIYIHPSLVYVRFLMIQLCWRVPQASPANSSFRQSVYTTYASHCNVESACWGLIKGCTLYMYAGVTHPQCSIQPAEFAMCILLYRIYTYRANMYIWRRAAKQSAPLRRLGLDGTSV